MNDLQVFNNAMFGNVRILMRNNEPWFVAKDVCDCLEIKNTTDAIKRLDEDERARLNLGRQGEANVVNEYGLYSLVMSSRKPEAKEFRRWITHEVLPSIRMHGTYMTSDVLKQAIQSPDFLIQLASQLKTEQEARRHAELTIVQQAPKVLFADAVATSHTSIGQVYFVNKYAGRGGIVL